MKKILIVIFGLLIVGIIYWVIEGNKVKEIQTEIEIAAPPTQVWSLLIDINKWHEWSPIISKSSGNAVPGSQLKMTMNKKREGRKGGPSYSPTITRLEEAKYFSWSVTMVSGFIFTNRKIIELEETRSGTRLIHKETFSGMMVPMMWDHMEGEVPLMLNSMNKALKELAEK